jgi:hypothetical protein
MGALNKQVLRTTQKNFLFTYLQNHGFSPADFELKEDGESELVIVRHRSSNYFFSVSVTIAGEHIAVFSPGEQTLKEERPQLNWKGVEAQFAKWVTNLSEELQIPDLWSTITGDTQLIRLAADQDNRPFTPDEQTQVKKALDEIKAYLIKTHNLSGDRLEAIERQLSYLDEASARLGRKDWTVILLGSLLGMVSNLSLSADGTRDLFRFAGQIVKQLLGTILYLAGPH